MRSKIVGVVVATVICAAFAPGTVSASSVLPYTQSFGPEAAASGSHIVASLPKFNTGLGQLIGVTLELDGGITGGGVSFDNEGAMSGSVRLGYGGSVDVEAMGLSLTATLPIQYSDGAVGADDDTAADFLGADAFSFLAGTASNSTSATLGLSDDLSAFIGQGTFDTILSSSVKTYLETTGPYGPITTDPGTVVGSITVRYEYVIPEPATVMLFCLGGVALLRRRF